MKPAAAGQYISGCPGRVGEGFWQQAQGCVDGELCLLAFAWARSGSTGGLWGATIVGEVPASVRVLIAVRAGRCMVMCLRQLSEGCRWINHLTSTRVLVNSVFGSWLLWLMH